MITDRTAADLQTLYDLRAQIINRTATAEQWTQWLSDLKGAYNASDLNRVESFVASLTQNLNDLPAEISAYLSSLGVAKTELYELPYTTPVELATKTDWQRQDIPRAYDMARYLSNVAFLRGLLELAEATPTLPESMESLDYQGANDIESVLLAVNDALIALEARLKEYADNTAEAWFYLGDIYLGDV